MKLKFEQYLKEKISKEKNLNYFSAFDILFRSIEYNEGEKLDRKEFINKVYFRERELSEKELLNLTGNLIYKTEEIVENIEKNDFSEIKRIQLEMSIIKEKLNSLEQELYLDELTGLSNRKYINKYVLTEDKEFKENGFIIVIDLNKFKQINDTYGHKIGDLTLIQFSKYLKNINLKDKICVRYSGDEFVILCKDSLLNINKEFLNLKKVLKNKKVVIKGKDSFKIDFSYGIEEFRKFSNYEKIFNSADKKMYKNKNRGV